MNDKIERKIKYLKEKAEQIQSSCKCILSDIEDMDESDIYDTLCIIENNFTSIYRSSDEAIDAVRNAYDDIEE